MKDTRKITGNDGENRACTFLENNGYKIVARNFRKCQGEIDIIAVKNDVLVFVEVKTLPNGTSELLSHVLDKRKQKRIIKTPKKHFLYDICLEIRAYPLQLHQNEYSCYYIVDKLKENI